MLLHQLPDALGIVTPRPPCRHLDVTPASQWLTHHELVAHPLAFVLVVDTGLLSPPGLLRRVHLAEQLFTGLVEADHRASGIVRPRVGLDDVLHPPDILAIRVRGDTPGLHDPRVDVVFLRAWRTVSSLRDSTSPRATSRSVSNCKVQQQRPSGGSLQANSMTFSSRSPLILILSGRAG